MKAEFNIPITPNFILGKVGSCEVKLAINEMDKDDLELIISLWTQEMWNKFNKPQINTR